MGGAAIHQAFPELETERLALRRWSESCFEEYARVFSDPELARYIGGAMDRARAWRHMAALAGHWVLRGFGTWAVHEKASGRFIGSIGLWRPEGWPELELNYWLIPETHRKGYATEAGRASLDYAFGTLGAGTVVSYIAVANEPSMLVARRLGGVYEKTIELLDLGQHQVYRYRKPAATK